VPLDEQAAVALAGPPVVDLASADDVEAVSAADVEAAQRAAEEAEQAAADAERKAIAGRLGADKAASLREHARFARLRAALTAQQAARHAAAIRLQGLDAVGSEALSHAAALAAIRDATLADLASIETLVKAISTRVAEWNQGLAEIAARGVTLGPDPLPPGGMPLPSSAHVWAGITDRKPRVIVRRQVITYIDEEAATNDLPAAIAAASAELPKHDPDERLMLGESGIVVPIGADKGGTFQRRIDAGQLHELTFAEREAYYRGEPITWETIHRD